ncbi:MAG TPA: methyltransferase domain-containing protein, partial [Bryobacteraceae bacterium]|nr:methyltransferase domain-containing protein [Bryobacteraceae bacterium]
RKRVLDAGCGTGYGCAALAGQALSVTGLDIAPEAIAHAREHSAAPGVEFLEGSCSAMPLPDAAFDLVISFEVIEHLEDWNAFLLESRRVLAPGGIFLLSTPNRDYYAEARSVSGPNPFHVHEFTFDEFRAALGALFPHVHLFLQNHVEGIAFQPAPANGHGLPELQQAGIAPDPNGAHFFLAACSGSPQPPPAPFVYVPTTANVLHERELHIAKLEIDVDHLRGDKEKLVEMFRIQKAALEEANRWSGTLDEKLAAASDRIVELQAELQQTTAGFEAQVATLEGENRAKTEWSRELDGQLAAALARVVELQAEDSTKNAWARELDEKLAAASARILQLQNELEQTAAGFEAQIATFKTEDRIKTEWARQLDEKLAAAEAAFEAENLAKTEWAMSLSAALEQSNLRATNVADQLKAALSRVSDLESQLSETATSGRFTFDDLQAEICAKTKWGQQLTASVEELQRTAAGYAAQLAKVEAENDAKTVWARRLDSELEAKGRDLAHCVEVLHATETTLEERTARMLRLEERVNCATASRWVKLGNLLGLGPRLNGE